MLEGPLALPVYSVTNVERVEEEALLKEIISDIETNHLDDLKDLELTTHFELLKHDAQAFFREVTIDASLKQLPTRTQLEEDRKHLQSQIIACMLRILGAFPESTETDLKMRTTLLSPFAIQNDKISAHHRTRRNTSEADAPEVDTETGEEIPTPQPAAEPEVPHSLANLPAEA